MGSLWLLPSLEILAQLTETRRKSEVGELRASALSVRKRWQQRRDRSSSRRILFKLRQRGIHLVPRIRVGCPHICLRVEPARIIEARRSYRDKLGGRVGLARQRRTAFRAKTPIRLAARLARRGMETQRALQEPERFRRHDDEGRKRASAGLLAISTVTMKHHHRFRRGFVANRAASASA